MNAVGKPDRLGQDIRCVVSVSMLTEGWDANTVTHILGIRAFGMGVRFSAFRCRRNDSRFPSMSGATLGWGR